MLKIPEEHDLESQIRKEREWRFLRNTRVRRQAQQVVQRGKRPSAPPQPGCTQALAQLPTRLPRGPRRCPLEEEMEARETQSLLRRGSRHPGRWGPLKPSGSIPRGPRLSQPLTGAASARWHFLRGRSRPCPALAAWQGGPYAFPGDRRQMQALVVHLAPTRPRRNHCLSPKAACHSHFHQTFTKFANRC